MKLTAQQRDYFTTRIREQFEVELGPLEKTAAVKKAEYAQEQLPEFIASLGLTDKVQELKELEQKLIPLAEHLSDVMTSLKVKYEPTVGRYNREWHFTSGDNKAHQVETTLMQYCKKECEIAFKKFPEGAAIASLQEKKKEALDYIYGYDQSKELLDGLANILLGTNVAMLQEYNGGREDVTDA